MKHIIFLTQAITGFSLVILLTPMFILGFIAYMIATGCVVGWGAGTGLLDWIERLDDYNA